MSVQRLTPEGLFKPKGYTQVIVATGRRMVFVSGQVSMDADGQLVAPGDVAGQARQVFAEPQPDQLQGDLVRFGRGTRFLEVVDTGEGSGLFLGRRLRLDKRAQAV